ncbi:hypothetical protein VPH35_041611 [Triticum aestivum]
MEDNKVMKVLGPSDPKIKEKEKRKKNSPNNCNTTLHTNHTRQRSSDFDGELRRQSKVGVTKDHRTNHLSRIIVYHRPPTAASTSQQRTVEALLRTRRRREPTTKTKDHASDIAHRHHCCHRSHRARPIAGSTKGIKVFKTAP